jgi:hypothetical protein
VAGPSGAHSGHAGKPASVIRGNYRRAAAEKADSSSPTHSLQIRRVASSYRASRIIQFEDRTAGWSIVGPRASAHRNLRKSDNHDCRRDQEFSSDCAPSNGWFAGLALRCIPPPHHFPDECQRAVTAIRLPDSHRDSALKTLAPSASKVRLLEFGFEPASGAMPKVVTEGLRADDDEQGVMLPALDVKPQDLGG